MKNLINNSAFIERMQKANAALDKATDVNIQASTILLANKMHVDRMHNNFKNIQGHES